MCIGNEDGKIMAVAIYNDYLRDLLKNLDCILAYDTAADYLGLTNGGYRPVAQIFSKTKTGITGVQEKLVDDFQNIEYATINGLNCTIVNQTIIDLLYNDGDEQIIVESLANYYDMHNDSFEGLDIPEGLKDRFHKYCEWAQEYYEE